MQTRGGLFRGKRRTRDRKRRGGFPPGHPSPHLHRIFTPFVDPISGEEENLLCWSTFHAGWLFSRNPLPPGALPSVESIYLASWSAACEKEAEMSSTGAVYLECRERNAYKLWRNIHIDRKSITLFMHIHRIYVNHEFQNSPPGQVDFPPEQRFTKCSSGP